jgi:hypothetical protein
MPFRFGESVSPVRFNFGAPIAVRRVEFFNQFLVRPEYVDDDVNTQLFDPELEVLPGTERKLQECTSHAHL